MGGDGELADSKPQRGREGKVDGLCVCVGGSQRVGPTDRGC